MSNTSLCSENSRYLDWVSESAKLICLILGASRNLHGKVQLHRIPPHRESLCKDIQEPRAWLKFRQAILGFFRLPFKVPVMSRKKCCPYGSSCHNLWPFSPLNHVERAGGHILSSCFRLCHFNPPPSQTSRVDLRA